MNAWMGRLPISIKIVCVVALTLLVVTSVSTFVLIQAHRESSLKAMTERAASFTALADETKNYVGDLGRAGSFDHKTLMGELTAALEADPNYDYTQSRAFNTIPVVAGWTAAAEAAEREGLSFYTPAFEARNPDNEPTADADPQQGAFRAEMLTKLEQNLRTGGAHEIHAINTRTNTLHYMRAIVLDASCMSCHGTPGNPEHDPDGDGLDPLGFPMESWAIGDMHGAFEVAMPLGTLDADVAGFVSRAAMIAGPLAILGTAGLFLIVRSLVVRPVQDLAEKIRTGPAEGDMTARFETSRRDEVGTIFGAMDSFVMRMRELLQGVRSSAEEVAKASEQISSSSNQMAGGMSEQAAQVSQIAAAMEEMSQTATEVASRSAEASSRTSAAGHEASEGRGVVQQTVDEMEVIADHVNNSAVAVQSLGEQGEQIGQVISVIKDIADQTNLLALNAAIEAARAGEHGRGFAVVADEVRKLAERTTVATDEVAVSISSIQKETEHAVERMEVGRARVTSGVDLAKQAGEALEKISEGSESVAGVVQGIAAAAEEQAATASDVSRNIEQIDAVCNQTASGAQEMSRSAGELNSNSTELLALVDRFTV